MLLATLISWPGFLSWVAVHARSHVFGHRLCSSFKNFYVNCISYVYSGCHAPGTVRNLQSQWNSFHLFCAEFDLVPLPASPQTISAYASFLACRMSSFHYIMNHLNAVRLLHLYHVFSKDSHFQCDPHSKTHTGYSFTPKSPCHAWHLDFYCSLTQPYWSVSCGPLGLIYRGIIFLFAAIQPGCILSFYLQLQSASCQARYQVYWLYALNGPKHVSTKRVFTSFLFPASQTHYFALVPAPPPLQYLSSVFHMAMVLVSSPSQPISSRLSSNV